MRKPQVGDYIETGHDEGELIAIRGAWGYYHSESSGKTQKRLLDSMVVCPSPASIALLKKEIRDSHNGQPRECNPGKGMYVPEHIRQSLAWRRNNNYLRG